jgi:transcriptional regulator with XRE-family HTH domain
MTRPELAQAIGITNQRYRRLELGTRLRQLDSEIVDALARALAVPPVTVLASLDAGHQ